MKQEITLNMQTVSYTLQYKRIKNINLRIKPDGSIFVSAPYWVSKKQVETFLKEQETMIFRALSRCQKRAGQPLRQYYREEELKDVIYDICKQVYPLFEHTGISFPCIRFRKMVSRWGSCHPVKEILTFNLYLMYVPYECIRYVVLHEFAHFLEANHSKEFYRVLETVCPDWKFFREKLRDVDLSQCKAALSLENTR